MQGVVRGLIVGGCALGARQMTPAIRSAPTPCALTHPPASLQAASYPVQNGCDLSRARVITFRHNDVEDLEAVLKRVAAEDRRLRRPLNRRFILVEGIYANTGEVAPLDKIMPLKQVGAVVGAIAGVGI